MTPPTRSKTDNIFRVRRGGGWGNGAFVRAAFRYGSAPSFRNNDIGFRCAQRGARQPLVKVTP